VTDSENQKQVERVIRRETPNLFKGLPGEKKKQERSLDKKAPK